MCIRDSAGPAHSGARRHVGNWRGQCISTRPMRTEPPHVVVLAGGEGNRLASLTRALYGRDLPKQFAVLSGERSLLQTTIERAALLTSHDRISVVVTSHHETIARSQPVSY